MSSNLEDKESNSNDSDNEHVRDDLEHMKLVEDEQEKKSSDAVTPANASSSANNEDNILECEDGDHKESTNEKVKTELSEISDVLKVELPKETRGVLPSESPKETEDVLIVEITKGTENLTSVELSVETVNVSDIDCGAEVTLLDEPGSIELTEVDHVSGREVTPRKDLPAEKGAISKVNKEDTGNESPQKSGIKLKKPDESGNNKNQTESADQEDMLVEDDKLQNKNESTANIPGESDDHNKSIHKALSSVDEKLVQKAQDCTDSRSITKAEQSAVAAEGHDIAPESQIEEPLEQNIGDVVRDFFGPEGVRIMASDSSQSTQDEMSDYSSYATETVLSDPENRDQGGRSSVERRSAERRLSPVQEDHNAESDSVYEESLDSQSGSAAFHQRNQWLQAAAGEEPARIESGSEEAAADSNPDQVSDASNELENSARREIPEVEDVPCSTRRRRTRTESLASSSLESEIAEDEKLTEGGDHPKEARKSWQKIGILSRMKSTISSQDSYFGDDEKSVSESIKIPTEDPSEAKEKDILKEVDVTGEKQDHDRIVPDPGETADEDVEMKSPEKMDVGTPDHSPQSKGIEDSSRQETQKQEETSSDSHEVLKESGIEETHISESNPKVEESPVSKSVSLKASGKTIGKSGEKQPDFQVPSGSGASVKKASPRSRKSSTSSTSTQSPRGKSQKKRRALKIKDKRTPKKYKKTSEFRKLNISGQLLQNRWGNRDSTGVVTRSQKNQVSSGPKKEDAEKSEWTDESDEEAQK